MNKLAYIAGYLQKRSAELTGPGGHIIDGTGPHGIGAGPGKGTGDMLSDIVPKNEEEAIMLLAAKKADKKADKKAVKKDLKKMEVQLSVLRALKKQKEMDLYT